MNPNAFCCSGDYASLANIIVNEAIRAGIKRAMQAPQDGSGRDVIYLRYSRQPPKLLHLNN